MSEIKSQFFNGKTYSATDFVESNKNTMKDGILPNTDFFKVLPAGNMTIGVTSGRGWVQGHAFSSDGTLSFTLDNADGVLDRVDTVVIRLDLTTDSEKIECKVIKGALGGGAATPVRDGTYYDLVIAQIAVAHGTTAITSVMITDKRGDGNLCGWSGAISGDQFNFDVKADKTYCDDTLAALTAGTIKTNADRLQNKAISATAPTAGQAMCYNGSQWVPKTLGAATVIASGSFSPGTPVNYSQSAINFRYLCYVLSGGATSGGSENGEVGFVPVGALPVGINSLQVNVSNNGLRTISLSSTSVSCIRYTFNISCYITVWGVS